MRNRIFKFGHLSAHTLAALLFYAGTVPLAYVSTVFGKRVYATHFIQTGVQEGNWYKGKEINNMPMGILQGTVLFIILIVIWKVVCESAYLILRYLEKKNRER